MNINRPPRHHLRKPTEMAKLRELFRFGCESEAKRYKVGSAATEDATGKRVWELRPSCVSSKMILSCSQPCRHCPLCLTDISCVSTHSQQIFYTTKRNGSWTSIAFATARMSSPTKMKKRRGALFLSYRKRAAHKLVRLQCIILRLLREGSHLLGYALQPFPVSILDDWGNQSPIFQKSRRHPQIKQKRSHARKPLS